MAYFGTRTRSCTGTPSLAHALEACVTTFPPFGLGTGCGCRPRHLPGENRMPLLIGQTCLVARKGTDPFTPL